MPLGDILRALRLACLLSGSIAFIVVIYIAAINGAGDNPAAGDAARAMRGSSEHNRVKKESNPAPLFFFTEIKLTLPGITPWKGRPN